MEKTVSRESCIQIAELIDRIDKLALPSVLWMQSGSGCFVVSRCMIHCLLLWYDNSISYWRIKSEHRHSRTPDGVQGGGNSVNPAPQWNRARNSSLLATTSKTSWVIGFCSQVIRRLAMSLVCEWLTQPSVACITVRKWLSKRLANPGARFREHALDEHSWSPEKWSVLSHGTENVWKWDLLVLLIELMKNSNRAQRTYC